ncbi:hypothetical protein IQ235_17980 [Oscillatoriales cyanobacterium LEGE 11467]|uniref:Uncharacterized protein n=1 Tax=Zarconia navalis LEGE 11467 TaxID=1828826 RepID=A0A928ZAG0_9CYAN|nr:hypothetical protein [Zarconia navalis]MBE9042653.1 hypothetical protein [Zarconia navalis LEGE 11467]
MTHLIEFVVSKDLQAGGLQTVLNDFESPRRQAFALYQQRKYTPLKVQLFLEFLLSANC